MATLTLHHGENTQVFIEHPLEVARRALNEAADLEEATNEEIASSIRRVARLLPQRKQILRGGE